MSKKTFPFFLSIHHIFRGGEKEKSCSLFSLQSVSIRGSFSLLFSLFSLDRTMLSPQLDQKIKERGRRENPWSAHSKKRGAFFSPLCNLATLPRAPFRCIRGISYELFTFNITAKHSTSFKIKTKTGSH